MLAKGLRVGAGALTLAGAIALTPASAKPAPQPAPLGTGFFPCSVGSGMRSLVVDEQRKCLPLASDAVQAVRARQLLITQNPAEAGCLGKDAAMCIATLSRSLTLGTRFFAIPFVIPIQARIDIQGKPIPAALDFYAAVPGLIEPDDPPGITLLMRDGVHVSSVVFSLRHWPSSAETEEEWDQTGVYPFATAVLGPGCVGTDKLAFYRRVDSVQKSGASGETRSGYYGNLTIEHSLTGVDRICGKKMTLSHGAGYDSHLGNYAGSALMFEDESDASSIAARPEVSAIPATGNTAASPSPVGVSLQGQAQNGADRAAARGGFGFSLAPTPAGSMIVAIAANSPAAAAGLKRGQVIEAMNGISVKGMAPASILDLLGRSGPTVTLSVVGGGDVKVTKRQ